MSVYIGPYGGLVEFKCPISPMDAPYARMNSEVVTIGGVRHTQRAKRSLRSWSMEIDLATPEDLAGLIALEQGVYGPPPWQMYDPVASYVNMLVPSAAAPGIPAGNSWETGTPGEPLSAPSPNVLVISGAAVEALSPVAPVVGERPYTAAAEILDRSGGSTTGELIMEFLDSDMAILASSSSGSVTSPNRATVTATAPVSAAGVRLRVVPSAGTDGWFGSFQVVESGVAIPWNPGMGVVGVSIPGGFQQTYIDAFGTGSEVRRQIRVDILEVGNAA